MMKPERENELAQALENRLDPAGLEHLLQDREAYETLREQLAMDAALRTALEDRKILENLQESILASVKTSPAARLEQEILTASLDRKGKAGGRAARSRLGQPFRFTWGTLPRWTTAAAAIFLGGLAGSLLWPGVMDTFGLGPLVAERKRQADDAAHLASSPQMDAREVHEPGASPVPETAPEQAFSLTAVLHAARSAADAALDEVKKVVTSAEPSSAPAEAPVVAETAMPSSPVSASAVSEPVKTAVTQMEALLPAPLKLSSIPGPEVSAHPVNPPAPEKIDFEKQVLPLLRRSCFECHSGELKKPKGGIRLDDLESIREKSKTDSLIFPHKPERSSLYRSLNLPAGHEDVMPPEGEATPLTPEEKDAVRRWLQEGADFGNWTSERARQVQISTQDEAVNIAQAETVARRVDELLIADLTRNGLEPRPPAADSVWLRRVYLDLVGRIPTTGEARQFLADAKPGKKARLVDGLLASNGHVSHMFNYWCGLLRARDDLAEGVKGDFYLAWIKQSVRDNKPYDQWARELISPEGYGWRAPAAGYYLRDGANRAANIESTATLFLGTQISCAQCHDHPYDRWTRKDYHQFLAWTSGIQTASLDSSVGQVQGEEVRKAAERYDTLAMNRLDPARRARYERISEAILALQRAAGGAGVTNGEGRPAELPADYQYPDAKPGDLLPAAVLYGKTPAGETRAADTLAAWVTSAENTRFSLTLANRLWAKLFGLPFAGPVDHVREIADCDNPDLAQYMVHVVRESGYDVRKILRILCLTRAYQQEAGLPPADAGVAYRFPGPVIRRLTSEQVWDSMMALAVKDLDVKLDFDPPGVAKLEAATAAEKTSDVTRAARQMVTEEERTLKGEQRRTRLRGDMAQEFAGGGLERASELPQPAPPGHFLRMFGQGGRDFIGDAWSASTVPQALLMLNSDFFDHVARSGSPLSESLRGLNNARDVARGAFMAVLTREPSPAELEVCLEILGEARNPKALARTLLSTAEFVFQK